MKITQVYCISQQNCFLTLILGDYATFCQINLSEWVKAYLNVMGGTRACNSVFCSWLYLSSKFTITERALPEKTTLYTLHGKGGRPLLFSLENEGGKGEVMNLFVLHPYTYYIPIEKINNSSLSRSPLNP